MYCSLCGLSKSLFFFIDRSVSKVHDEWFADEEKVRKAVGFLERPVVEYPNASEVSILHVGNELKLSLFCLKGGHVDLWLVIWCSTNMYVYGVLLFC